MGSFVNPDLKSGVKINGKDAFEYDPSELRDLIHSDESGMLKAIFKNEMMDTDFPLPDNYAEHAGRPSLTELPFMGSENDGYPYLSGHAPNCSGPDPSYVGGCWCKWIESNSNGGPMWVGGPDADDFDM